MNPKLGNFLYWYLTVECPEIGENKKPKAYGQSYQNTLRQFIEQLEQVPHPRLGNFSAHHVA